MADLCASFQAAAGDVLVDRSVRAMRRLRAEGGSYRVLVVAGGVAANLYLRGRLEQAAAKHGFTLEAPPLALCTDNAIMVAWAGIERLRLGPVDDQSCCGARPLAAGGAGSTERSG